MAEADLVLAIDQGTSATKTVLVDGSGTVMSSGSAPLGLLHPRPGWVEQSPIEILDSVRSAVVACFDRADGPELAASVVAVGLSTQRESLLLWERSTGQPLAPLLSWQDQRTLDLAERIGRHGVADFVLETTGLPLDPMFSALKACWLLDHYDPDRRRSRNGELCLGTVDSWLLARWGAEHQIEVGNAARTQLLNLFTRQWDSHLLAAFDVPLRALPQVRPSTGPFGSVSDLAPIPAGVPVTGVLGDSHAALYAHAGWRPGVVKATYGTGSSVMALTSGTAVGTGERSGALCSTIAWDDGAVGYAVEGNIRASGATLRWLADLVGRSPAELADLAARSQSDGVVVVPAFTGLGAPYWDPEAVGLVCNLHLSTRLPQLARAVLESVVFQVDDVVRAAAQTIGPVSLLMVDGGPTANSVLMQAQADLSGCRVHRPIAGNLSALGAAHLAGLGVGRWTRPELEGLSRPGQEYQPDPGQDISSRRAAWDEAVSRSRSGRLVSLRNW